MVLHAANFVEQLLCAEPVVEKGSRLAVFSWWGGSGRSMSVQERDEGPRALVMNLGPQD